MTFLTDDIEAKLDEILAEVMVRQRRQANTPRTGSDEVGPAMARLRRCVRVWGGRATYDAPRVAVAEHRP